MLGALARLFGRRPVPPAAPLWPALPDTPLDALARLDGATFARVFPDCVAPEMWAGALRDALRPVGVHSLLRLAMFLAQTGHETLGYTRFVERFSYSAERLDAVFSAVRGIEQAKLLVAAGPEAIANAVYANRLGNGDAKSGDGWRFRGRGPIQITGRANYAAFGRTVGITAEEAAGWLQTPEGGARAAAWFWQVNGLNAAADAGSVDRATAIINPGLAGLADRRRRYDEVMAALA